MNTAIKKKPLHWKYKLAAVILLILITLALVMSWFKKEQKPDPASEKLIRETAARQLNKDPNELTKNDFVQIKELRFIENQAHSSFFVLYPYSYVELSDIRLLREFTNLERLYMNDIRYTKAYIPRWMILLSKCGLINPSERKRIDLRPLENLTKLRHLDLSRIQIGNIEPLKKLTNLESLELVATSLDDYKSLSGLTNLKKLNLALTRINDLEPVKNLVNLQELNLMHCMNITQKQVDNLQKILPELNVIFEPNSVQKLSQKSMQGIIQNLSQQDKKGNAK